MQWELNRGRLEDLTSRQLGAMILLTLYHGFTSMNVGQRRPYRRAGDRCPVESCYTGNRSVIRITVYGDKIQMRSIGGERRNKW